MKNIFERLALMLLSLTLFAACQEDEGTDPGNDSTPVASVYEYAAGDGYNVPHKRSITWHNSTRKRRP